MKAANDKEKHEYSFLSHWKMLYPSLPVPVREYRFAPPRQWRFDFAWPELLIAVECHGGGHRGRHSTVTGMANDLEKQNAAVRLGWRLLAYGVVQMKNMAAVVDEVAAMVQKAKAA